MNPSSLHYELCLVQGGEYAQLNVFQSTRGME